jgi:hypothetical protein
MIYNWPEAVVVKIAKDMRYEYGEARTRI